MNIQIPDEYSITFHTENDFSTIMPPNRTEADRVFGNLTREPAVTKIFMNLSFDGVMDQIRFYEQEKPNGN